MSTIPATQVSGPAEMISLSLSLDATADAPAKARALVDELPSSLDPAGQSDLKLALSELVTNSVLHGLPRPGDRVDVQLTLSSTTIRCEVADRGPGFRVPDASASRSTPTTPGGLGLVIVDRIAARWGTLRRGRTVWFELRRTA